MTWNRSIAARAAFVAIAVAAVVIYLRLMMGVTAQPVVPYQITSGLSDLPVPTLTVLQRTAPRGAFDYPTNGANVTGQTQVRGWAIDAASEGGTGVDRVQLYLDDSYLTDATYGNDRQDVGGSFGDRFAGSGWEAQLDLSQAPLGQHTLTARVHSTFSDRTTSYTTHIVLAPAPSQPHGAVDSPTDRATVSGVVQMSGWALDETASSGTGIDRVEVYLDGRPVASASYGVARADVATGYGAQFTDAGWRASVDLTGAGAGTHQLDARAHSTIENKDTSYTVTVVVGSSGG
jgi:Big-like domain-containing protein